MDHSISSIPLPPTPLKAARESVINNNQLSVDDLNKSSKESDNQIIEINDSLPMEVPTIGGIEYLRNSSVISVSSDDDDSIKIVDFCKPPVLTGGIPRKRKLDTTPICGKSKKPKLPDNAHITIGDDDDGKMKITSTPMKKMAMPLKADIGISPIVTTARRTLIATRRRSQRIVNRSQQTGTSPLATVPEEKVMVNMQTSTTGLGVTLDDISKEEEKENIQETPKILEMTSTVYKSSQDFISSNVFHKGGFKFTGLRPIVIDGSNIAMSHSHGTRFSVRGLQICIDFFVERGHKVYAFIPAFRMKRDQSDNQALLMQLVKQNVLYFTSSREVMGRKICSYDDRILVQAAAEMRAVIVSCDNYRDLVQENPRLSRVIADDILAPTWVDDMIIFPQDPRGRFGPTLDQLLRYPTTTHPPPPLRRLPAPRNLAMRYPPRRNPPPRHPPIYRHPLWRR